jgi:LCP family protein required for cell wall assembly
VSRSDRLLRRWPLILATAVVLTLVLLIGGAVGLRALVHRYENSVTRAELLDSSARTEVPPEPALRGPLNYLLIGSDKRASDPGAGQRSDTIIIAQVDRNLSHVFLISVPRDLMVDIPAYAPTRFGGASGKINAAFGYGGGGERGVQLLSLTLTRLTGLKFDGAVIIEFSGFKRVINLLGGVDMCVDHAVRSIHTNKLYPVGCRHMNGADALDYSRQRYGLPDGDYDRQRHQQQLLKAMFQRAGRIGLAGNPLRLDALLRAVGQSLTVDTGGASLADLVLALRHLGSGDLTGIRLPSYPDMVDGTSYVFLQDGAGDLFAAARATELSRWAAAHPRWVNKL